MRYQTVLQTLCVRVRVCVSVCLCLRVSHSVTSRGRKVLEVTEAANTRLYP